MSYSSSSEDEDDFWGDAKTGSTTVNDDFMDEAAWLKPVSGAREDQDAISDERAGDSDDDGQPLLQFEVDAMEEAIAEKQQAMLAGAEWSRAETEMFEFPTLAQLQQEQLEPPDPASLQHRIAGVLQVLARFNEMREEGRPRSDYVKLLELDMGSYFGYNEFLVKQVLRIFSPVEAVEFMEANEQPRPVTIRCNTLKSRRRELAQALMARGINLDPAGEWTPVGIQVHDSQVPVGATPEYLAGHYMLQGAASWLPVMALQPQPGEKILDMCAAPGGKTTYVAALMQNKGTLFANDASRERLRGLVGNIHRMGITNTIVTNLSGEAYPKATGGFDRVLLDAPCSGLGVISRDPRVKVSKSLKDVQTCAELQKKLILHAIDSVNAKSAKGAVIIYCTCTFSVEENEAIVQHALDRRNVELVDTGLSFGVPGFAKYRNKRYHPSMTKTRRYYPHTYNMDGFYVAKLVKLSNKIPSKAKQYEEDQKKKSELKKQKSRKKRSLRKRRKLQEAFKAQNEAMQEMQEMQEDEEEDE